MIFVVKKRTRNRKGRLSKWKHLHVRIFYTSKKEAEAACEAMKRNVGERDYKVFTFVEKK